MLKMTRWFIWGLFTLLLVTAIDQLLLRVDLPVPGYVQVHEFYIDFRERLIGLTDSDSVGQIIKTKTLSASATKPHKSLPLATNKVNRRYLYVDAEGALQFADNLEEVPLQFRRDAQPLSE